MLQYAVKDNAVEISLLKRDICLFDIAANNLCQIPEIGRASCRERV